MKPEHSWRRYLRFWRPSVDADIEEELRFHLDARAEELAERGVAPEAARAQALAEFGSIGDVRVGLRRIGQRLEHQRARAEHWAALAQDLRFAVRSLRRQPAFVAVAVLTLALGIGANTAIFSVVDAVLLKPLPFRESDQLVSVWPENAPSKAIFVQFRDGMRSLSGVAGYSTDQPVSVASPCAGIGAGCEPQRLTALPVSAGLFDLLGARAMIGRAFTDGDDQPGRDQVAVLSHAAWTERFAGDPRVLGTSITVDGATRTIVGVMPAWFAFPSARVQLWLPATIDRARPTDYWWGSHLYMIARLRPGATTMQASADARVVAERARTTFPMRMPDAWGRNAHVVPLKEQFVGRSRETLLLLLGAVSLVLLVACVNVANLLLARTTARQQEMAIRTALGAGRWRLIGQLLTESTLLAVGGAVAGLAVTYWLLHALVALLPANTPRVSEIGIDARVLAFTVTLALLTGVASGLLPALRASRGDLQSALKSGSTRTGTARRRLSEMLVVAQVALAVILVAGAGLLIKSLWLLQQVDPGFSAERVVAVEIPLPSFPRDTATQARAFYDQVLGRVRALPHVRMAAVANTLPFGAAHGGAALDIEAHPTPPGGDVPFPELTVGTADYLRVLGIPLLRGRSFADTDRQGALLVALVDATAARTLWPGESAMGQRIKFVWSKDWITVVGVVGDVRRDSLSAAAQPSFYLPYHQAPAAGAMQLVLSTDGTDLDETLASAIRNAVASVDRTVPVGAFRTMRGLIDASAARPRFTTVLLAAFAAVALLLGAVGIYGVISYAVTRRTREIGVRMALGARRSDVLRLVAREGGWLTAIGVGVGLVIAVGAGRLLAGLLYGVRPTDPLVLMTVPVLLAIVALVASLVPARRASRVDPVIAMRE